MKKIFAIILIIMLIPSIVYAGRGCCSWHGGQAYCDEETGRWVCQDGTYSPSCKCSTNNTKNEDEKVISDNSNSNIDDNTIPSIIIILISYYVMQKFKLKEKNKYISKICNVLFWILSITFGWLVIPLVLGLYGHFILEIISIIIICIIIEYSDE